MSIESAHLLLITHNPATATYMIELACQVGQKDCYRLNRELVSVSKHIEPTLVYKDEICLTEKIEDLSEEQIYQMACLLNYNAYDFDLKGDMK